MPKEEIMKLTKPKLLKHVNENLLALGFIEFKDSVNGSQGLFIKMVDDLFLSLGLTISRYEETMFTATYYLSKTTRWGSIWGDIPSECYARVGTFLTEEERENLLDGEFLEPGVRDAWWDASFSSQVEKFYKAIKVTEKRVLDQPELLSSINNSVDVKKLAEYSSKVIEAIHTKLSDEEHSLFLPKKNVDSVPIEWFKTAEFILAESGEIRNANTVKLLAVDSWRQNALLMQE